jgi:hypothetical protein
LENILGYIKNRAQWMQLMKAKTIILKLTEGLKNNNNNNINSTNNTISKYKIIINNEIYSQNSKTYNKTDLSKNKISSLDSDEKIFKDLDKEMGNSKSNIVKGNNNNNQNNIKNSNNNNNKINNQKNNNNKKDSFGLSDLSYFDTSNKKKYEFPSRSIGEFPTGAKSIESTFTQKIFKGLQDNFRRLFTDVYLRFITEEDDV